MSTKRVLNITRQILYQTFSYIVCYYWLLQDFDFVYPENVAYPIGGPGSARFLVVQLHYNNPELQSGMFLTVCVAHNYVYYLLFASTN